MDRTVAGLVLAGGRSLRFGTDKAWFKVRGRPMIERVASTVSTVCSPVLISLGFETHDLPLADVRSVRDRFPGAGPLAGIEAGLSAANTDWVLVVACDMPFITAAALRIVLRARTPSTKAVIAIDSTGRSHPLCGCYRRDLVESIQTRLSTGRRSMHGFLARLDSTRKVVLPDISLHNMNRPEDLVGSLKPNGRLHVTGASPEQTMEGVPDG